MCRKLFCITLLAMVLCVSVAHAKSPKPWWKKWNNFPNAPRITASSMKQLMLAGEKMIFVYAGYKTEKVICGSIFIPYTSVPPNADGSKARLRIPKDYWIMCY